MFFGFRVFLFLVRQGSGIMKYGAMCFVFVVFDCFVFVGCFWLLFSSQFLEEFSAVRYQCLHVLSRK